MASDAKPKGIAETTSSIAYKAAVANLAVGAIGAAALFFFKKPFAAGFAAGYIIGVANALWMLRIARKGVGMKPDKAGRFVTLNYHARFLITAAIFAILISSKIFSPWPLVAGLTGSIFTTIIVMIAAAREEASQNA
ncbi:MAG: ATP synthase subunit I [Deltaproteobacteria bacterium]|nr:ATP synthase subunit I [Deltaproteobacteria bacterium]